MIRNAYTSLHIGIFRGIWSHVEFKYLYFFVCLFMRTKAFDNAVLEIELGTSYGVTSCAIIIKEQVQMRIQRTWDLINKSTIPGDSLSLPPSFMTFYLLVFFFFK